MISRNLVAYFEQDYCVSKEAEFFFKMKTAIDAQIKAELIKLHLTEDQSIQMRRAINVLMFEICHEEGYPYDYNGMIRALEKPNPFYGEMLVSFLEKKLTTMYFFSPKSVTPPKIFQFPIHLLDRARELTLKCLYELRNKALQEGNYKALLEGHWDIIRGKTQINPYKKLEGELDFQNPTKKIGNIFFAFKKNHEQAESQRVFLPL